MQVNETLNKEIKWITLLFISALYLFYIADGITKLLIINHIEFDRLSVFIRSIYQVIFFFIILKFPNERRRFFLFVLLLIVSSWIIGVYSFAFLPYIKYDYGQNIIILNKYLYVFIIYFSGYKVMHSTEPLQKILQVMELIFIINSILAIIGFVAKLPLFNAFPGQPYRFGYNGLIFANNEAAEFYFIGISYFYYKGYILGLKGKWKLLLMLLGALLLGSKGIYFFLLLLLIYHIFFVARWYAKIILLFLFSGLVISIISFILSAKGQAVFSFLLNLANRDGVISMLLSSRDKYAEIKVPLILNNWTIVNCFFGGQDQFIYNLELDLLDLFFFFGIVGTILLLFLYFKTIFRFKKKSFFIFYVALFFFLSALGGHMLYSALNAIYLCIISFYFIQTSNSPLKLSNCEAIQVY